MSRRGENIYKRKDGRWEGRILKSDGKYGYVYAKTYKEVKEKKKDYQAKPFKVKLSNPTTEAAKLFEEWLNGDLVNRIKTSTYGSYYSCLKKYVIPFFSKEKNKYLTEFSVIQFVQSVHENQSLSQTYKRKILTIFKTALKEVLHNSPDYQTIIGAIKLPKIESKEVQVFSMKEQNLIENTVLNSRDRRVFGILLCFYTGIRLGELCALRWEDIDFESGTMSVTKTVTRVKNLQDKKSKTILMVGTPKSRKSVRKLPLPAFLICLAKKYRTFYKNENCYLLSGTNTPIDPRVYQKLFKKILEKAGVRNYKFHAIRHTFATRALELGVDIKTLSEILGHSNVSITLNIYAHSLMEQKKVAMCRFNEMHSTHMTIPLSAVADSVRNP